MSESERCRSSVIHVCDYIYRALQLTISGRNGDEEICRTRLEACRIENREFELAEGFKDLGHDHPDSTKTWDWVCLPLSS